MIITNTSLARTSRVLLLRLLLEYEILQLLISLLQIIIHNNDIVHARRLRVLEFVLGLRQAFLD